MTNARVFSGVQPTGSLHLGNYLGAILRFIALQEQYECLYCIVDLHAITVWQDPETLRNATRETAAAFLASGLDANKNLIFNQARVSAHSELAWIFNCVARMGWLNRMTQFKEKSGKNRENASVGLFTYPNLMAADVLLYKATIVPVGEDQKQHIELARDVAQKFNSDFAQSLAQLGLPQAYFPLPAPMIPEDVPRVMSLRDGAKKMSKSDVSDYSRINLSDSPDLIVLKIQKSKTDSLPFPASIAEFEGRPEAQNLAKIYGALSGEKMDLVLETFGGKSFSTFKTSLAELLIERLSPIASEMNRLKKAPDFIDSLLEKSAEKARLIANKTLAEVKNIVGLLN